MNIDRIIWPLLVAGLIACVFASCQPVYRYESKEPTEDSAEVLDCQNRLEECAEDRQVLIDSITKLNNHTR